MTSGLGLVSWVVAGALVGWTLHRQRGNQDCDRIDDAVAAAAAAALAGVVFSVAVGGHDPFAWDSGAFVVALGGAFAVLGVLGLLRRA